jgi:hypothetical protein
MTYLPRQHLALAVRLADARQLRVVVHEEVEILVRNVDVGVSAQLALQLRRLLATRKGVLLDLVLNLLGRVLEEDGRRVDAGRHLAAGPVERVDEAAVDERRLGELDAGGDVASDAEVGVLGGGGVRVGWGVEYRRYRSSAIPIRGCRSGTIPVRGCRPSTIPA